MRTLLRILRSNGYVDLNLYSREPEFHLADSELLGLSTRSHVIGTLLRILVLVVRALHAISPTWTQSLQVNFASNHWSTTQQYILDCLVKWSYAKNLTLIIHDKGYNHRWDVSCRVWWWNYFQELHSSSRKYARIDDGESYNRMWQSSRPYT